MTIPEAAQLVIQVGAMRQGGDRFVLEMGKPVKIIDLAKRMIELSGLTIRDADNPNGDIALEIISLRLGENPKVTLHKLIMKAHEKFLSWEALIKKLNLLEDILHQNDVSNLRKILAELVSGYQPSENIVDWIGLEQGTKVIKCKTNPLNG